MTCMGFLTDEKLSAEAARTVTPAGRPQVVWPNGVLASTAVGFAVDLVARAGRANAAAARLLVYDGNEGNADAEQDAQWRNTSARILRRELSAIRSSPLSRRHR